MDEKILYFKYCSDDPNVINGIFRDHKIRFTQPWGMNDPLEFNPTLQFSEKEIVHQNYELDGISLPSIEFFYRIQIIESQINAYGVLSLTTQHLSFDMWSRYANGHKGFVLGFKSNFYLNQCMSPKNGKQILLRKVDYVDYYTLNIEKLASRFDVIPMNVLQNEFFFKKTSQWKDEQEYRLVRPLTDYPGYEPKAKHSHRDDSIYLFDFPLDCINDVVFGASMSVENKMSIMDYCNGHDVIFWQAVIIRDKPDSEGKSSKVNIFQIKDFLGSLDEIYKLKPQQFCIDNAQNIATVKTVKVNKLSDLPYYEDYKELVDQLFEELRKKNVNYKKS